MKFNIKYTIAALSVFMFTAGCDDKLDAIDVIGYTGVPYMHRSNIQRIRDGKEYRFGRHGKQ